MLIDIEINFRCYTEYTKNEIQLKLMKAYYIYCFFKKKICLITYRELGMGEYFRIPFCACFWNIVLNVSVTCKIIFKKKKIGGRRMNCERKTLAPNNKGKLLMGKVEWCGNRVCSIQTNILVCEDVFVCVVCSNMVCGLCVRIHNGRTFRIK